MLFTERRGLAFPPAFSPSPLGFARVLPSLRPSSRYREPDNRFGSGRERCESHLPQFEERRTTAHVSLPWPIERDMRCLAELLSSPGRPARRPEKSFIFHHVGVIGRFRGQVRRRTQTNEPVRMIDADRVSRRARPTDSQFSRRLWSDGCATHVTEHVGAGKVVDLLGSRGTTPRPCFMHRRIPARDLGRIGWD